MQLFDKYLFVEKSQNMMTIMFLPLFDDFETIGQYNWDSAYLVWLYRKMFKVRKKNAKNITELMILLYLCAYERFPLIAPRRLYQ